jgi:hypothetical protein
MKYLDSINDEIKEYYMVLCDNDYPYFIDKYINTNDLKRLDEVSKTCKKLLNKYLEYKDSLYSYIKEAV